MKTTVIHHSADYDGLFCREISRKFLPPDTEFIGWDFADPPLAVPEGRVYVFDLPCDRPFGFNFGNKCQDAFGETNPGLAVREQFSNWVWIDHHKSSIETHPVDLPGYRIDGVAACRLVWQFFTYPANCVEALPSKEEFIARLVKEPLAVRLAGEYDIWDHRGDGDLEFQFGLDAQKHLDWKALLSSDQNGITYTHGLIQDGVACMNCLSKRDADIMRTRSFKVQFAGRTFLALNTARCNSNSFALLDTPETGHSGLMAFYWNGRDWNFSMYHASHRKDIDLSETAVSYGGGGHRGACGFRAKEIEFKDGRLIVTI